MKGASRRNWLCKRLLLCGVVLVVLGAVGALVYRRCVVGPAYYPYPGPGPAPDESLPVNRPSVPGVDVAVTTAQDFPEFLGPGRRAGVDHAALVPDWEMHPPRELWRQRIGAGWSAFSVVNGFAVTMEQRGDSEQASCYALASGLHHWTVAWKERFGVMGIGPRSTPTIANGCVYALGAWGHLVCIDGNTGTVAWQRELLSDLGVHWSYEHDTVKFGRANSPLVAEGMVIVPGGGPRGTRASLLAFNAGNGTPIWRGGTEQISYSSPTLMNLLGEKHVVIVNEATVSGHALATGHELWSHDWPSNNRADVNASQPVSLPGNRILLSKGYRHGAAVIELTRENADKPIQVHTVWRNKVVLRTKFTNVVVWHGHGYGLSDGVLECVDVATGKLCWRRGKYGDGQVLRVRDLLLVLTHDGRLILVRLDSGTPNEVLGRLRVLRGTTYNNMALCGSRLLVRNGTEAACYELATQQE